ncbi:3-keto-5-aminohexanoate cleavage protein [Thermodesulfobacteriota bacterium]
MTQDKTIICVSPTGGFHGKEANPSLPEQPEEIAEEVYRSWNEGAAMVHIHVRDKQGKGCNDPEIFQEVDRLIRKKGCDIVIQHSTAPVLGESEEEGARSLEAESEMASLMTGLGAATFNGVTTVRLCTRPFIEGLAKKMMDMGVKPELEVMDPTYMETIYILIEKGLLKKPYWISFVMHMHKLAQDHMRYTPKNFMHCIDLLPPGSMFNAIAIAESQLPATTMSILLGGHLRVGFEDNIYYRRGELATSNAQLVARAARLCRELGRDPASPTEAREMLGLPQLEVK